MSQAVSTKLSQWQPNGTPRQYDPIEIIEWAVRRFEGRSIAMTTAYGMEGIALLHMLAARIPDLRVISIDTGFLFEETHRLSRKLKARFPGVRFETVNP